jgi:hypothetical protein
MFSTFFRDLNPKGNQVYIPEAFSLIIEDLSMSLWLINSASDGESFNVL